MNKTSPCCQEKDSVLSETTDIIVSRYSIGIISVIAKQYMLWIVLRHYYHKASSYKQQDPMVDSEDEIALLD